MARNNRLLRVFLVLSFLYVAECQFITNDDPSANKVKYESHLRTFELPPHFVGSNDSKQIPAAERSERRKRCSCGCTGCDLFPNRACCSSACCSSAPLPLACCPPPPPPKPCCQPAFGPCCPATPDCCPRGCCRGRRPTYEEYGDEEEGSNPVGAPPPPPTAPRTCCPAAVPPPPPAPPPPPPPAPEPPVQCCAGQNQPRSPCNNGCPGGNCGCGRPCCYYQNRACCNQGQPCCPPPLPCCPALQLPRLDCIASVPPCLRACPTCPCRKRVMLGKRIKRDDVHCQPGAGSNAGSGAMGVKTATTPLPKADSNLNRISEDDDNYVPRAGGLLYAESRHRRVKRLGCVPCLGGLPREKRSLDCIQCTYLQPQFTRANPIVLTPSLPMSPVGVPVDKKLRQKRAGCLPHPQCTLMINARRSKRNIRSQYCEPCGGHYGRKKREAERDNCLRRRPQDENCEADEFLVSRMKRQAYDTKGILDVVKVLSKAMASDNSGTGCLKFPACVLAQKKRRKRHAERVEQYHQKVKEYNEVLEEHRRFKRQFFAPDAAGSGGCVPCPAWVTLALASARKKREANGTVDDDEFTKKLSLSEAIADIRRRKGYDEGFSDNDDSPRRKQSCDQTDDCLNEVEYAIFKKVYDGRTKREAIFRRKKCERCGSGFDGRRVKRNFGSPTINASEQNCMAFPQCRHRVKRNFFDDCNICTPHTRQRKKRNFDTPQCYPCPNQ